MQTVKADTLSLIAWQVGMYGFMAIAQFIIFRRWLGSHIETNMVEFWFMQIAMIAGFVTSYPGKWWLLKEELKSGCKNGQGIKEVDALSVPMGRALPVAAATKINLNRARSEHLADRHKIPRFNGTRARRRN